MPSDTITLRNRTKRLLVLNLPHAVVPEAAAMTVVGVREHDATPVKGPADGTSPNAGAKTLKTFRRPVSGSVTLTARGCAEKGDRAEGLPRSVLQAPDVKAALRKGDVEVVEEAPAAKPVPEVKAEVVVAPAPPPPAEAAPGDGKKRGGKNGGAAAVKETE
jgi:hypothetical protein